ncbi:hypothetical protein BH11MYX2_BH11MYX2_30920 [soil metagenome]
MRAMYATRVIVIALAIAACSSSRAAAPETQADRAFYFWRSSLLLSPTEKQTLVEQHVTKLYVRAFDLGWNPEQQRADVMGALDVVDVPPVATVPVVFIRQDVFAHLPASEIPALAQRTWDTVVVRTQKLGAPTELQLDCDWTDRSRDNYFAFARELKRIAHVPLSATIRLHQIKYRERTGVPPVDRGALMLYNMGEIAAGDDQKAIFDAATTKKYIARLHEYPLPLDVALPIWSWTLHARDGAMVDLMQSTDPDELPTLDFVQATSRPTQYIVTRTAFLHGVLLREGDTLEIERTTPADTLAAAALVRPLLSPARRSIVLFDLSDRNLSRYPHDQLAAIFRSLR